jgi:hypothetical protein
MAKEKKPGLIKRWIVSADGFNFYITEDSYQAFVDRLNDTSEEEFVLFVEDGDRETSFYVRKGAITRLSTGMFNKE